MSGKTPNSRVTHFGGKDVTNGDVKLGNVGYSGSGFFGNDAFPLTMPIKSTKVNTNGYRPRHLTAAGVIYGVRSADARIFTSIDWGVTWVPIAASSVLPATPRQVKKLDSGKLIAFMNSGQIFVSDVNEANFVEKYNTNSGINDRFGVDVYGDLILVGGYGGVNTNKCFISRDGGETFSLLLTHPSASVSHFHDVRYDPYENIIWASSGDYENDENIFYSNDLGRTWNTTWNTEGGGVIRTTTIIPLPKCVLFVSDTKGEMFVWRYDRLPSGTEGQLIKPTRAWYYKRDLTVEGDVAGSIPAITYGANASAFFGWYCYRGSIQAVQSTVFATKDGYSFTPIYVSPDLMNIVTSYEAGVFGVFGPTDNNELLAYCVALDDGLTENLAIKIEFPGWG